ncbi:cytochrome c oxidase subunit II [Ancylobacter sp. 6x-1]|uniref:Cytochrome c oxidase subunit 2 n=1 Tax=Ancylobacter crimeensis TaxID=2579147 RepID=A0ABT0D922_9HYPH|nr:cytochrome c oxidase subunit II [Ancylobacter crimeensis]MCK0196445.1 cytochrome c oxidase subunit II [Ancylobacter crimeensis]
MQSWISNIARSCARYAGSLAAGIVLLLGAAGAAFAGMGQPSDWQVNFQGAASPVAESIHSFHNFLLVIIISVVLLVLVLLIVVMVRFNEKANPVPSKTTHHTLIEVLWTVVPVLILVAIAIPSFRLLFLELNIPKADLTVKITGHQWYWSYEYPDNGAFTFDSLMLTDEERKPDQPRLLAVDNEVVVPVGKVVRIQVTSGDVIHSFAMPSFGVKIDALPGRLNESWFQATREGMFYGQCSELCGKDHAFMPIAIRVVSEQDFASWIEEAKKKFAANEAPRPTYAVNDAVAGAGIALSATR